jgi:prevent-host-death family protein
MDLAAGRFKATCLQVMEQVRRTREPVIITKRGKPVAKLVPVTEEDPPQLFGMLKGTVLIRGDIVASTGEVWDAEG